MIALRRDERGTLLPVRARPNARSNGLAGEHAGALRVAVTAPPDQGKANQAIVEVLASTLKLRRSEIELVGGGTSRQKTFLVLGIDPDVLLGRIDAALEPTMFDPVDPDA